MREEDPRHRVRRRRLLGAAAVLVVAAAAGGHFAAADLHVPAYNFSTGRQAFIAW